jgi:fucose 4-O-acetylase-like acetyltransferase
MANKSFNNSTRSDGIDYLRGWLIVSVILGHLVLGSTEDNWIRYSIYAFHMPLFIGLTGYLLNPITLKDSSWAALAFNYWWRMLFPFAFAYVFFTGILVWHAFEESRISIGLLLSYVHTPYYHLWFIPTMVLWIIGLRIILKAKFQLLLVLLIAGLVSLYWACVPKQEQLALLATLTSKKLFYFFSFFVFGAWLRSDQSNLLRIWIQKRATVLLVFSVLLSAIYLSEIGELANLLRGVTWWWLNIILIALAVPWSKNLDLTPSPRNTFLVGIGRNSLPIYLWHVVPLFLLKGLHVHQSNPILYYALSGISIAVIVYLILFLENKSTWLNRTLYGVR